MYKVEKRDKRIGKQIIKGYSDRAFAGVLVGNNPGEVWVDDLENPSSALIWSDGLECFYFMGNAHNTEFSNQLNSFINTTIVDFLRQRDINCFEYSGDEQDWYPTIKDALSDRKIDEGWQRVYKSAKNQQYIEIEYIQEPYRPVVINHDFIAYINKTQEIINSEFLINYIDQFWGSIGNFLAFGHGFAALHDNEIVSFALSSFVHDKTQAIGVETLEQHRRQGLSSFLVKMLLEEFEEQGIEAWWDCMESNIPSQKTAEKSGLVLNHSYKVCWFNLNDIIK
jgi:RimJ/RimL family protein N-acetyltransferase